MDKLVAEVIKNFPKDICSDLSITVALSGGVDSVALLHAMHTIASNNLIPIKIQLDAIHINHGISKNAELWTNFCKDYCQTLKINLTVAKHSVTKSGGESLENNARKIRYEEFYKLSTQIIALAHHKVDQVETTLTQIFRGSDLHNIAAMRMLSNKQNKTFWRPLLNLTKQDLEEYVKRNNLTHIVDESNTNNQYLRNFIRNKIIPELSNWDKHIDNKILKINEQIQSTLALTDEIADYDLHICSTLAIKDVGEQIPNIHKNNILPNTINFIKFKTLSLLRQNNLINYFILNQNKPLPSNKQINEFIRQLNTCQIDKSPSLRLDETTIIIMQKKTITIKEISTSKT